MPLVMFINSAINAMILTRCIPIYVNPDVDKRLGISLGCRLSSGSGN